MDVSRKTEHFGLVQNCNACPWKPGYRWVPLLGIHHGLAAKSFSWGHGSSGFLLLGLRAIAQVLQCLLSMPEFCPFWYWHSKNPKNMWRRVKFWGRAERQAKPDTILPIWKCRKNFSSILGWPQVFFSLPHSKQLHHMVEEMHPCCRKCWMTSLDLHRTGRTGSQCVNARRQDCI